jgi:hypothetical protein
MFRRALIDLILRSVQTDEVHGIRIADFGDPEHDFARHIRAALELIRTVDPRRFERVQRLRWIVNRASPDGAGWGAYHHLTRQCDIDFVPYEGVADDMIAVTYAGTIMHESTHCLLMERGCKYKGNARARHERICIREENRFCRRLEELRPGTAAWRIQEFDPERWNEAWNRSRFEHVKALWRRMEERGATA